MRKVFLDDLPTKDGVGKNTGRRVIDWDNSVGTKVEFTYGNITGEIEILDYKKKGQCLTIRYEGNQFEVKPSNLQKCSIGGLFKKYSKDFKIEIETQFKDGKRDLIIVDREYRDRQLKPDSKGRVYSKSVKWYKYKCEKCSYEGWMEEGSLLNQDCGCSCCRGLTAVLGINTIWDTDRWMISLGVSEECAKGCTKGSRREIEVKCPDCGHRKKTIIHNLYRRNSIGCICGDGFSIGHKYTYELLSQLEVNFIDNYKPTWAKYYNTYKGKYTYGEYDFFVENMKLIIEVDGGFHRKDNEMSGQTKEESQHIDDMKDKIAKENGYEVIRIPYECGDFRENILNSKLADMFNMDDIKWQKCVEFSLKNIVKEVCVCWNNKKEWESAKDLAEKFKLSIATIQRYLKKGVNLGWCYYSPEDERSRRNAKIGKLKGKQVKIFKNKVPLGVFESCCELERKSIECFGVKLLGSGISQVCRGKRKSHKGFTFEYIEENQGIAS